MADTAALRELERRLEEMETPRRSAPSGPAAPTSVEPLDDLLPRGGLPRGEGTEWLGSRSCGKTALLRAALERLRAGGEPVALVDAARTLYAPDWEGVGEGDGLFWVVRPPSEGEAAWCADLLLRSGAFGAVAGIAICRQRPSTSKGVTFVTLEDETGFANFVVMADVRERFRVELRSPVLLLEGEVEREQEVVNVLTRRIRPLNPAPAPGARSVPSRNYR